MSTLGTDMKLVLHIGMQKTGSSALQHFFHMNQEELRRRGIVYPRLSEFSDIHFPGVSYHNCVSAFLGDFPSTFPSLGPDGLERLLTYINNSESTVLLSAEDFSRILDLRELANAFARFRPRIVIYLREQTAWVESMYNQRNKILFERNSDLLFKKDVLTHQRLFEFLKVERYTPLLQYDKLLQRWSDVFEAENIIVRPFAKEEMIGGNLMTDFMASIGIDDIRGCTLPPRINENFANGWIKIFQEIDQACGREEARRIMSSIEQQAAAEAINVTGPTNILPNAVRVKMKSDYAEGNRFVARTYLNKETLFQLAPSR